MLPRLALFLCLLTLGWMSAKCQVYESDRRDCIVQTAQSQVGTVELTGHNDGVMVEKYLRTTGLSKGYAWCAAFVSWVYNECKIPNRIHSAWAGAWFTSDKVTYRRELGKFKKRPQRGDLVGFIWTGKVVQHIAILSENWPENSGCIKTIEGNTSAQKNGIESREGDGVWGKRRMKRSVAVCSDFISN